MPHTTIEEIVASDRNFIHACNLLQKKRSYASLTPIRQTALNAIIPQYLIFINENLKLSGHSEQIIKKRVELLNSYYEFLLDNGFDNTFTYIIHSGFISGYQNRYGDNLKPPTNVYHRMTA